MWFIDFLIIWETDEWESVRGLVFGFNKTEVKPLDAAVRSPFSILSLSS